MSRLAILFCVSIVLSACNQGGTNGRVSSISTTSTPQALRAIGTSELTAIVTIDGNTTSYFGRNYSDNNWIIYLNIVPEKEYPITIEWMVSNNILVMVQEGTLYAENTEDTATPVLISFSEGAKFDYDCDRISNLNETKAGTDPGQPGSSTCLIESEPVNIVEPNDEQSPTTPEEITFPVVRQHYDSFEDTSLTTRVTRFSQPMNVQTTNPNRRAAYRVALWDVINKISVSIDLLDDPNFGRSARFFNNNADTAVTLEPALGADATCTETRCSIPFDWKEDHWYELIFDEDASDSKQLHTSILDLETQLITPLGTLNLPATTVWTIPVIVLLYHEQVTAADCATGLLPLTLHHRAGTANKLVSMDGPISAPPTDCIIWGSGASTTEIIGDPLGNTYTLTLGER